MRIKIPAHALSIVTVLIVLVPAFSSARNKAGCSALTGEWNWATGGAVTLKGVVTLKSDRQVLFEGKPSGQWECTDDARGAATIHWVRGFVDSIKVTNDHITGTSSMPGVSVSATRRTQAPLNHPPASPSGGPPSPAPSRAPAPAPAPSPASDPHITNNAVAQTLQRCVGFAPGATWPQKPGPNPATLPHCQQLPAWASYQQAQQKFQAGDHAGAAQVLLSAAQAGNPLAAVRLAIMYDAGDGVARNKREAFRWYMAAAESGEPAAQNEAGSFYEDGAIISGDWVQAAKWYQLSAQSGWNKGQLALGRAYEYGIGVPVNLQSAIDWYSRAAAQGNKQAAQFAEYLRDNHGLDASTAGPEEEALYNTYSPGLRTLAHTVQTPEGTLFHNKAERQNFVLTGIARFLWNDYDDCKRRVLNPSVAPEDAGRLIICTPPRLPRP